LSAGLGGDSRLGADRGDTFGLGWYYTGVSNEFGPIPNALLGPREGTGVEFFYRIQARPWLSITPDVQFIKPGITTITSDRDAFVYGVRVNMKL
ncbi:MAG: carbohydrate porin, partial [Planctomycetota bacterium]